MKGTDKSAAEFDNNVLNFLKILFPLLILSNSSQIKKNIILCQKFLQRVKISKGPDFFLRGQSFLQDWLQSSAKSWQHCFTISFDICVTPSVSPTSPSMSRLVSSKKILDNRRCDHITAERPLYKKYF